MKLAVMNCDVFFEVDGKNIVSIEIQKTGEPPYKIKLLKNTNKLIGNTIK